MHVEGSQENPVWLIALVSVIILEGVVRCTDSVMRTSSERKLEKILILGRCKQATSIPFP
jgi:hypothetical protein